MINLFLTTYYLIDYFFYKENIFYQSQKFRVGICNGNQYLKQGLFASNWTEIKSEKKIESLFYFTS